MDMFNGARDTYSFSGQTIRDVDEAIAYLQPSADPFTSLMIRTKKKRTAYAPKVEWYEDQQIPVTDTIDHESGVGNAYAADEAVTAIRMASNYHLGGDVLFNPTTGERFRITSFNASTKVATVVRGWGTSSPGLLTHGVTIFNLGNAAEEGGTSADPLTVKASGKYNYIQEILTSLSITTLQDKTKMYGGDDRATQRAKKLIEHKIKREMAMLFGVLSETAGVTNYIRTMRGLVPTLTSNLTTVTGSFTEYAFEVALENVFQYGSDNKVAFCAARPLSIIGGWGRDKIQLSTSSEEYGLQIWEYKSQHGKLALVYHKLFTGSVYGGAILIADVDNVEYVEMNGMGTKLNPDIQASNSRSIIDQWETACSLVVKLEPTHGLITGITS